MGSEESNLCNMGSKDSNLCNVVSKDSCLGNMGSNDRNLCNVGSRDDERGTKAGGGGGRAACRVAPASGSRHHAQVPTTWHRADGGTLLNQAA
jgi:hypothetical protein